MSPIKWKTPIVKIFKHWGKLLKNTPEDGKTLMLLNGQN